MPPCIDCHSYSVVLSIPCGRRTSPVGDPRSCSAKIEVICAFVNLDSRFVRLLS
jgi:hypothetical protein